MKTTTTDPVPEAPKSEPHFACTVLVAKTQIGAVVKGYGARVRLPKSEAEALASLTPPRVRIDGV